jgi:hypothetical protein
MESHQIHRLDKRSADEGKNEGQVFEMGGDGYDQRSGGDKEQQPIKNGILPLLYHKGKNLCECKDL